MYCCSWGRVAKSYMIRVICLNLLQMTVTYVQHIPNSGSWGFYRILAKWRGSLYKVGKDSLTVQLLIENLNFNHATILRIALKGYLEKPYVLLLTLRGNKRFLQVVHHFPLPLESLCLLVRTMFLNAWPKC